jgi:pyruvate,water dikinase
MVKPVVSGVLFSKNPMTGSNEIVIESIVGEGTQLVQDGITPDRWVSRNNTWVAKPDQTHLTAQVAKEILNDARKIIKRIKKPIDLEWVWNGEDVCWVQVREITTLSELNVYSNRFSKDMMPGMIHPLIWSINIPLINTVWLGILEEIVGNLPIKAEDLAKSFFYRSYFNMGAMGEVFTRVGFPSEGLEMMMGLVPVEAGRPVFKPTIKMLPLLPKLTRFIVDKWRLEKKIQSALPAFEKDLDCFSPNPDPETAFADQVKEINALYKLVQRIVYFNVLAPVLASMYARILESQLKKLDVDLLKFDLLHNFREIDPYQPNIALANLHQKLFNLADQGELHLPHNHNGINLETIQGTPFESDFSQFTEDFGHLSDNSNNFMAEPWRENPEMVLKMVYDHQEIQREQKDRIRFEDLPLKGLQKIIINFFYQRTRRFTLYREQISKNYIYSYGLFRPYFMRLAENMVKAGWLHSTEDIFYLQWNEIQQLVKDRDDSLINQNVTARKKEMNAYQDIVLPDIIYGDDPPPAYVSTRGKLSGTPTSQGYYSGNVKVIKGRGDFDKVKHGDVIVIPYSDVGWTPLFVRAGAVIAESGGLLSHSSIIAREYHIPAVVSVPGCMQLKDHQPVSVNGFTGEIVLLEEKD